MRDDWPVSHLGEAVELGKGGSWGADSPAPGLKEAFCLRGTDLAELINGKRPDAPRRWLKQSELSKSQCKPDMVLIETSGSKCGRSLVLTTEMLAQFELPVVYSNFCRTLKIDTSKLSSSYAELWFSHNYWNGVIPSYRATSAMPNLDVKSLLRMETLLIPPLEVQQRIVDLASSVDSYIAALQQQADAARVARSAVLSELLSAGGEDWIEMTIESFARLVPGKYIPKSKYEENGSYFIYGSNSVMGKYSTALIDVPHVVMAAIGAYAGAVRYSSQPSWVNNNAFGLVTNDNVDPFFFYLWLEQCLDLRQVVVGTGQPYVQRPALKNTVVNVPPVKEQRRIVDIVSSLDEVFSSTERAIIEAKRLRSGLLSDLLSGHHEIPESYDQLLGAA